MVLKRNITMTLVLLFLLVLVVAQVNASQKREFFEITDRDMAAMYGLSVGSFYETPIRDFEGAVASFKESQSPRHREAANFLLDRVADLNDEKLVVLSEGLSDGGERVRDYILKIFLQKRKLNGLSSTQALPREILARVAEAAVKERNRNILLKMNRLFAETRYIDDSVIKANLDSLRDRNIRVKVAAAVLLLNASGRPEVAERAQKTLSDALISGRDDVKLIVLGALNNADQPFPFLDRAIQDLSQNARHPRVKDAAKKYLAAYYVAGGSSTYAQSPQPAFRRSSGFQFPPAKRPDDYSIAVIIGNRAYQQAGNGVPDVNYAVNDASAMREYVEKSLGYRPGNIIFLENASQADMISTFGSATNHKGKLFDWVRPNRSKVFVYYSGHGAPGLNDGNGYLLPVDARPSTVELNGYSLDTLYKNLGKIPASSVTVVIDACFSGSSHSGAIVRNASSISLRPITMPKRSREINVLTATDTGEVASWDDQTGHGLFTSYFLKGVTGEAERSGNGDGRVDLEELRSYLDSEVTYMARRLYSREQHPQVLGDKRFVFSEK